MTPAHKMRTAAKEMRNRAEHATPGPWFAAANPQEPGRGGVALHDGWLLPFAPLNFIDALHIASWPPGVALAVAEWLDVVAGWHDEGLGTCPEINQTNYPDAVEDITASALAVARAYLGREATS